MMEESDQSKDNSLARELGRWLQALAAAGKASMPTSSDALLSSIVEAAARIFGAAAASILLVDETESALVFKVAYGAADRNLVGTRIPLNQGIAGYVAMSGQPIAISDVTQDARFNREFAQSTGYVPKSILATPLLAGERVIGVMEVLDKIKAPAFGMQDMELLGLFARQAALAIDQAQLLKNIDGAILQGLQRLAAAGSAALPPDVLTAVHGSLESLASSDLFRLADQLNELSRMGEAERQAAIQILEVFGEYSRSQRRISEGTVLR